MTCLPPDSATFRAVSPDWMWGLPEMLAADIADSLHWLIWAKTDDARRGRNRPKPVPRPGLRGPKPIGTAAHVGDMNKFLGWEA